MIKEKQNETSLLSFYKKIEICQNTPFPNEVTTDPNVTYNILETYIICQVEIPETCEDQIEW